MKYPSFGFLFCGTTMAFLSLSLLGSSGCGKVTGQGTAEKYEELSAAVCDPSAGPFTIEIDNPFFPLPPGRTIELEGDENGVQVHLTFAVTDETEEVAGVMTRVVTETSTENGEVVEISRNFFAQAPDGTVCYFGEDVDIYEGGVVVNHEGAWKAGEGENLPGIIMPSDPRVETRFVQEIAPGIAGDVSAIIGMGETVSEPGGKFTNVLHTLEWNPVEGQTSNDGEEKFYAPGVGLIEDDVVELVSVTN
ncbi:MAG TPA: hypothetical protein VLJ37_12185 [bacterium]|nr:hypothetical protein [bacterium]